ncbi:MAG: Predicted dehydrogenase [uncultured Adhaeribacter sp.]|uniref:Predicted dehydrogenase n=1 Tax=uncultured Adhaeribacter sp. TaxID=448109 RepID=A0A6J4IS80_9BACT|nr:MAG: Predicted dehydrogenase [uncultured Adhaeribacter sp.]
MLIENKKIGVGIIGASEGSWAARAHLPALLKLKDQYEVVAISTKSLETAKTAAEKFGVAHAFANEFDLVQAPGVDLVVVAVKVPQHYHLVKTALGAGKMVYCEWPLGNGTPEAEELAALAREKIIKTFNGLQARSLPELKFLKDFIAGGGIGQVLSSNIIGSGGNWGFTLPNERDAYMLDPKNGATMMHVPFAHTMDGVAFCLGEWQAFSALLARQNHELLITSTNQLIPQLSNDHIMVNGTLEGGAVAAVHYRGGSSKSINFYWEIKGSKGEIVVSSPTGHLQFGKLQLQIAADNQELKELPVPDIYGQTAGGTPGTQANSSYSMYHAYKAVANDLAHGTTIVPDFEHAVRRHKFLDAIEKSAAQRGKELV